MSGLTAEDLRRLLAERGIALSDDDLSRALPTALFLQRAAALVREAALR